MKIIIKMMCLFFLLACTKDEMNTFEGAIPFYKEGISNLRSDILDKRMVFKIVCLLLSQTFIRMNYPKK